MFKFLRFVITVFIFALLASCANENKDNLLLDAEGGVSNSSDNNEDNEIEIIDNTAQKIDIDEVELTVEQKLV